jgi:hypothetical protein
MPAKFLTLFLINSSLSNFAQIESLNNLKISKLNYIFVRKYALKSFKHYR